jgi:hypothetical protein
MRSTHRLYRLGSGRGLKEYVLWRFDERFSGSPGESHRLPLKEDLLRPIAHFFVLLPLLLLPYLAPTLDDPVVLTNPDLGCEAYLFWPHDFPPPLIS